MGNNKKIKHSCSPLYSEKPSKETPEIVPFYDGEIQRYRVKNQFLVQANNLDLLLQTLKKQGIQARKEHCGCNPNLIKVIVDDEGKIEIEGNPKQLMPPSGETESLYFNEVIVKPDDQFPTLMDNSEKVLKSRINKSRNAKKVAILDTGIATNLLINDIPSIFLPAKSRQKPCGKTNKFILGTDITNSGNDLSDITGHGSFVINSLLFSIAQEGIKSIGIIPVKVFKRVNGILTADLFDILCGLYYAQKQNVDYINLSFGVESSPQGISMLSTAIQAITKNCKTIITCSGGNKELNLNEHLHIPSGFSKTNPAVYEALAKRDKDHLLQFSNYYKNVPPNGQSGIAVCGNFSFKIPKFKENIRVEGTSYASPYLLGKIIASKSFSKVKALKRQLTNEAVQVQLES